MPKLVRLAGFSKQVQINYMSGRYIFQVPIMLLGCKRVGYRPVAHAATKDAYKNLTKRVLENILNFF